MRKIIINLVVLSVLGSPVFAGKNKRYGDEVVRVFTNKGENVVKSVQGSFWSLLDNTVNDVCNFIDNYDLHKHIEEVGEAHDDGEISQTTKNVLARKGAEKLPINVISQVEDQWLKIASSGTSLKPFPAYLDKLRGYADNKNMSLKKYLILKYGTDWQKWKASWTK